MGFSYVGVLQMSEFMKIEEYKNTTWEKRYMGDVEEWRPASGENMGEILDVWVELVEEWVGTDVALLVASYIPLSGENLIGEVPGRYFKTIMDPWDNLMPKSFFRKQVLEYRSSPWGDYSAENKMSIKLGLGDEIHEMAIDYIAGGIEMDGLSIHPYDVDEITYFLSVMEMIDIGDESVRLVDTTAVCNLVDGILEQDHLCASHVGLYVCRCLLGYLCDGLRSQEEHIMVVATAREVLGMSRFDELVINVMRNGMKLMLEDYEKEWIVPEKAGLTECTYERDMIRSHYKRQVLNKPGWKLLKNDFGWVV